MTYKDREVFPGVVHLPSIRARREAPVSFGLARREELEARACAGELDEAALTRRPGVSTFIGLDEPERKIVHIAVLND